MCYGPLRRMKPSVIICIDFCAMAHIAGFGYALWAIAKGLVIRYGPFAETVTVDYHLSIVEYRKEYKHMLSVSDFSKQTEVCRLRFPFAENKQK